MPTKLCNHNYYIQVSKHTLFMHHYIFIEVNSKLTPAGITNKNTVAVFI